MKIYQDLDGCVADFVRGVAERIYELAHTDIETIESKTLRRGMRRYLEVFDKDTILTSEDMGHKLVKPLLYKIATADKFFYNLKIMDGGLWDFIKDYKLEFLTAACGTFAYEDKAQWCKDVLGSDERCFVVGKKALKVLWCEEGDVLIDDHKGTIESWNDAGGNGFLWTGKEGGDVAALKVFLDNLGFTTK